MRGFGPGCGASMRAIDTNVLVRLIIRDEPAQVGKAESFVYECSSLEKTMPKFTKVP